MIFGEPCSSRFRSFCGRFRECEASPHNRLAILGITGMLACRQEFAVMAATFALIPPREPESLNVTLRWRACGLSSSGEAFWFPFFSGFSATLDSWSDEWRREITFSSF